MVFVRVEPMIRDDWRRWMQSVHIPDVMRTGCFQAYEFDYDPEADEHLICYHCPTYAAYERYQTQYAPRLQEEHTRRYVGRFSVRRYVMVPI